MTDPNAPTQTMDEVRAAQAAVTESIGQVDATMKLPVIPTLLRHSGSAVVELVESWRLARWAIVPVALIGLMLASYSGTLWLMPDALPDVMKPPTYAEKAPGKSTSTPRKSSDVPRGEEIPVNIVRNVRPPVQKETEAAKPTTGAPSESSSPSVSSSPSDEPTKEEESSPSATPSSPDTTSPPAELPAETPATESPEVTLPPSPVVTPDAVANSPSESGTVAP